MREWARRTLHWCHAYQCMRHEHLCAPEHAPPAYVTVPRALSIGCTCADIRGGLSEMWVDHACGATYPHACAVSVVLQRELVQSTAPVQCPSTHMAARGRVLQRQRPRPQLSHRKHSQIHSRPLQTVSQALQSSSAVSWAVTPQRHFRHEIGSALAGAG